ncbi:MAG: endonuclease Q family protein, partial [Chloroflexota bacterium]|nr:endonuclease Q family protein [Chloroflexota bacterium]
YGDGGAPATPGARFVLGTEVSCVYRQAGRGRRVHLLLFAPGFDAVHRLCAAFAPYGALASDGRPTLSLSARDAVEAALDADPRCIAIPAHAWTPWFSVYGAKGGFDSLAECFGDMLPHVPAVETGLSSDPAMNWRVPELDDKAIVSFSDAHSAPRIGREATVFDEDLSYGGLR